MRRTNEYLLMVCPSTSTAVRTCLLLISTVTLWPSFNVFARDTDYEGGERLRFTWWRQAAAEQQLKVVVEEILEAARVWRRQESGRRGGRKGGSEASSTDSKGWGRGKEHRYAGTDTCDTQVGR